jgi:hypothetical protein
MISQLPEPGSARKATDFFMVEVEQINITFLALA